MATAASTSSQQQQSSQKNKKRQTSTTDDNHDSGTTLSTTLPAQLVMTAVLRILSLQEEEITTSTKESPDYALLTTLAADLVRAVVRHAQNNSSNSPAICVQAENEWLQSLVKSLLSALSRSVSKYVLVLRRQEQFWSENLVEICQAVASSLHASADLIALAGTRLSRSPAILSSLEDTAWRALTCSSLIQDSRAASAISAVLASMPLAGGTERATPASLWTKTIQNVQGILWMLMQKSIPLSQRSMQAGQDVVSRVSTAYEKRFDEWWTRLHQADSQNDRVSWILHWIRSLISLLITLLQRGQGTMVLLEATLNVSSLLDLVDALLSVPMSAEATYYGTKKRLRDEPLDSGVLTPTSIATMLANHLYIQGHRLLSSLVSILGKPNLLPYTLRLREVGYAGVLTSCSPTLRQVLEPGYNIAKKRRWLPHSLVARTSALRTLQVLTITLGVRATSARTTSRNHVSSQAMDRIVKVISGCILEQLYPYNDENLDWGSMQERIDLVQTATECLSSTLLGGGEFLTMEARQLVESVAATCLSYMKQPMASLCSISLSKSFFRLGEACVSTSWPDGAASALRDALYHAAQSVAGTGDASLDYVATSAIQLCDTLSNPAVPALYIVTRHNEDPPMVQELVAKMAQARADAKARKEREEQEEKQRKKIKTGKKPIKQNVTQTTKDEIPNTPKTATARAMTQAASKEGAGTTDKAAAIFDTGAIRQVAEKFEANRVTAKEVPVAKQEISATQPVSTTPASMPASNAEPIGKPPVFPRAGLKNDDEESDLDEDFPMIVDAAPDEDDLDDDENE